MKPSALFIHCAGEQAPGEAEARSQGSGPLLARLRADLPDWEIVAPVMPEPDTPRWEPWRDAVRAELAARPGIRALVGHSLGGSVLAKVLAEDGAPPDLKGLALVAAPYWGADPDWDGGGFTLPPDLGARLAGLPVHLFHAKNDGLVPSWRQERYALELPGAFAHALSGGGHWFRGGAPGLAAALDAWA